MVISLKSVKAMSQQFIKDKQIDDDEKDTRLVEAYDDILDKVNQYFSLYDKNKFRQRLNDGRDIFLDLPINSEFKNNKKIKAGKLEVLQNILIGLHANAAMGTLKVLGTSTPFGQLQVPRGIQLSPNAYLIYQSPTGLFERKIQLKNIPPLE